LIITVTPSFEAYVPELIGLGYISFWKIRYFGLIAPKLAKKMLTKWTEREVMKMDIYEKISAKKYKTARRFLARNRWALAKGRGV
jgi:hypothetical protein